MVIFMMLAFVLGGIATAFAQQDIIENLEVVSIKSVQVRQGNNNLFLDVKVNIKNANKKELRLRDGKFEFFIASTYNEDTPKGEIMHSSPKPGAKCDDLKGECFEQIASKGHTADESKYIGTAVAPFFIPHYKYVTKEDGKDDKLIREICCQDSDVIYLRPTGSDEENIIMFHVNIGGSEMKAFASLMQMMNCTAYPGIKTPHLRIKGKFDLGVRSSKGWSDVEKVKIEWLFNPSVQHKVPFLTAAE